MIQGNVKLLECVIITGGPCDGDEYSSVGTFEVDDQEGCSCKGVRGYTGLYRLGKCASRCSLGWYIESWDTQVNNWGAVTDHWGSG